MIVNAYQAKCEEQLLDTVSPRVLIIDGSKGLSPTRSGSNLSLRLDCQANF